MDADMMIASRAYRRANGRTTWATPYYPHVRVTVRLDHARLAIAEQSARSAR